MKFMENILDNNREWKQELSKEERKEYKRLLSIAVQIRKATRRKNKKITEEFQFQKVTNV